MRGSLGWAYCGRKIAAGATPRAAMRSRKRHLSNPHLANDDQRREPATTRWLSRVRLCGLTSGETPRRVGRLGDVSLRMSSQPADDSKRVDRRLRSE